MSLILINISNFECWNPGRREDDKETASNSFYLFTNIGLVVGEEVDED